MVMVGAAVAVANGISVGVGVTVVVGVGVGVSFRASKPRANTEATPNRRIALAIPPMIHGSQFICFLTTSLKLAGTAISTTVMLSCPPRELAISINAREASF